MDAAHYSVFALSCCGPQPIISETRSGDRIPLMREGGMWIGALSVPKKYTYFEYYTNYELEPRRIILSNDRNWLITSDAQDWRISHHSLDGNCMFINRWDWDRDDTRPLTVVGGSPQLGNWQPEQALIPHRINQAWLSAAAVTAYAEYKLVSRGRNNLWEPYRNRAIKIPADGRSELYCISSVWGEDSTTVAIVPKLRMRDPMTGPVEGSVEGAVGGGAKVEPMTEPAVPMKPCPHPSNSFDLKVFKQLLREQVEMMESPPKKSLLCQRSGAPSKPSWDGPKAGIVSNIIGSVQRRRQAASRGGRTLINRITRRQ